MSGDEPDIYISYKIPRKSRSESRRRQRYALTKKLSQKNKQKRLHCPGKKFTTQTTLNTANSLGYRSDKFTHGDTSEKENIGKKTLLQRASEHMVMLAAFCEKNVDTSTQQNF